MTPWGAFRDALHFVNSSPKTGDFRYREFVAFLIIAFDMVQLSEDDKFDVISDLSNILDGVPPSKRAQPLVEVKYGRA